MGQQSPSIRWDIPCKARWCRTLASRGSQIQTRTGALVSNLRCSVNSKQLGPVHPAGRYHNWKGSGFLSFWLPAQGPLFPWLFECNARDIYQWILQKHSGFLNRRVFVAFFSFWARTLGGTEVCKQVQKHSWGLASGIVASALSEAWTPNSKLKKAWQASWQQMRRRRKKDQLTSERVRNFCR